MINTAYRAAAKRTNGFVLVTVLVFLAVITLLTLHSVQLATQDLLLAANVQHRTLAQVATLREVAELRGRLATGERSIHSAGTSTNKPSNSSDWIGCFESPWVPLERPAAIPAGAYDMYRAQIVTVGPSGGKASLVAVLNFPTISGSCEIN